MILNGEITHYYDFSKPRASGDDPAVSSHWAVRWM